jgi:hypothetical protein
VQMLPSTVSVNVPFARFSFPVNVRFPVAPASFPVESVTGPAAVKSPVAMLKVPVTATVSVPPFGLFGVNVTVPVRVTTSGSAVAVAVKCPSVVPWIRPPPVILARVCPTAGVLASSRGVYVMARYVG